MSLGAHGYLTAPEPYTTKERKGDWIETYTGKKFYVLDPRADEICDNDISHALSNLCRFGGHSRNFYSVAEHSVNVAQRLQELYGDCMLALFGLYHDSSEGVLVDMPKPIKPYMTNYKEIEKRIQDLFYIKFCGRLPTENEEKLVKEVDTEMLWIEGYQLMLSKTKIWTNDGSNDHYMRIAMGHKTLSCLPPSAAETNFCTIAFNLKQTLNIIRKTG